MLCYNNLNCVDDTSNLKVVYSKWLIIYIIICLELSVLNVVENRPFSNIETRI